jgi:hypothetical protein
MRLIYVLRKLIVTGLLMRLIFTGFLMRLILYSGFKS